ncbi:hypothetical protein M9434_006111 [Picochlorum sp. BPE23]|nr:hypothetical protein M9434_006111 [Picochlorum sp. BPE23]
MFSRGGRFESFIRLGGNIYNAVYQRLFWRRPVGRNLGVSVPLGFKRRNHPHSSRLIDQRRGVSSTRVRTTFESRSSPIPTEKKKKVSMKKVVEKPVSINVRTHEATLRPKALEIAQRLNALYPNPPIPLHHGSGFQLLCAVVLSAQTTDIKVNQVTPALFAIGPDAESMSKCDVKDIQNIIATLGLAPTKAKNLKGLSIQLMEEHDGIVPQTYEELEALPGVGHKTASVVMSQVHGEPAFPVDTHIHRLAQRWGLTDGSSVEQTEADLKFHPTVYTPRRRCNLKPVHRTRATPEESPEDDQIGDLFRKELEKRNISSLEDIKDPQATVRPSVLPPPAFASSKTEDDQLQRSRNLNSEGLEGLIPRASQLLQLGASFAFAFGPFILFVLVAFGLVYSVFGDLFVHSGSPSAGVPQYIDPMELLSEPTVDPMIPM